MKHQLPIIGFLTMALAAASAQVASHTPTAITNTASAQTSPLQVSDKPVARVNGAVLTDRDLLREMYTIFPYAQQHNGFPKAQEAMIRQGALEMIIFEELVYQEATRRKLTVPSAQLNHAESEFRKQFTSPDQYQQYLQVEMHGSEQQLRQKMQRSLLIEQVLKTDVEVRSTVSAVEVQNYYEKNVARFQQPETFNVPKYLCDAAAQGNPGAGEAGPKESGRCTPASQSYQELPGLRLAGGKDLRGRLQSEPRRSQGRAQRQIAAAGREDSASHAGRPD